MERGKFSARPRNDPQYYGGEYPFVQTGDIASASIYLRTYNQTLNEKGLAVSRLFPKGTILLTIAANIGETAIADLDVACPDSVVAISSREKLSNTIWLANILSTYKDQLDEKATKNAQKNINLQTLRPLEILTPPLPEQRKIAEILSTWDRAIETTERLIANATTQKRALMQQLLTGKRRAQIFEKSSWTEYQFSDVFERVRRGNTIGNENVLTISGENGLISQRKYFNKRVAAQDLSGYTLLRLGDFAYNKSYSNGYPYGAIKMHNNDQDGVVSSLYICFTLKDDKKYNRDFLRHYFEAGCFNRQIYKIAQEGARNHGLLNMSVTDFFASRLVLPQLDEQNAIEEIISDAESIELAVKKQVDHLREEKKALMQQLLTGKRRVAV